jgi:tight adherence protein C
MPIGVELLRVALAAGLSPAEAVALVARTGPPSAAEPFRHAQRTIDLGGRLADGLDAAAALHRGFGPVAEALAGSADLGVAVDATLARIGAEARADVRRAAEARARTVPVRLLFPLVFLILPAFGLLGIAPALLSGFAS